MQVKIYHPNPDAVQQILTNILNLATVVALGGHIPSELEMTNPSQRGRYWWREDDKYHLASCNNDWWAFVHEESSASITLEFRYRNDSRGVADALAQLLVLRFRGDISFVD